MALVLRHFVAQHPHAGRLRKRRDRRLAAIKPSSADRIWYAQTLSRHVITRLRTAGVDVLEALRPHWPMVRDAAPPTIKHEIAKARGRLEGMKSFAVSVSSDFAKRAVANVDDKLSSAIKGNLGVDIRRNLMEHGPILTEMQRAQRENVELITSIPEQYFDELEERLAEGWNAGASWTSMVDDVARIGEVAENRAAFIARDQTNKANAAFNRVRQTGLGIKRAEWQTAGDGLVRDTHAEMEGKTFEWDDPPLVGDDYLLPGEDYNCRCTGAPIVDLDELPEPDLAEVEGGDQAFDGLYADIFRAAA
ncbi:MAG: phage minor head protein [Pseudomonadota bacterium]